MAKFKKVKAFLGDMFEIYLGVQKLFYCANDGTWASLTVQ